MFFRTFLFWPFPPCNFSALVHSKFRLAFLRTFFVRFFRRQYFSSRNFFVYLTYTSFFCPCILLGPTSLLLFSFFLLYVVFVGAVFRFLILSSHTFPHNSWWLQVYDST